ncbi:MAG: 50S ribosomal protein L18 [Verrucomicrobiales bacterium]
MSQYNRKRARKIVHRRIRKKVSGTSERPRLAVHFSGKNVYAQVIDDVAGTTLAAASSRDKEIASSRANLEVAAKVGNLIAKRSLSAKLESVVFDRGGHLYHGKVKSLADAAREGGLQF